jgi:hypothetical protein
MFISKLCLSDTQICAIAFAFCCLLSCLAHLFVFCKERKPFNGGSLYNRRLTAIHPFLNIMCAILCVSTFQYMHKIFLFRSFFLLYISRMKELLKPFFYYFPGSCSFYSIFQVFSCFKNTALALGPEGVC